MTRATRKCDRCRGPLGHRNESGVCERCQHYGGRCKVCHCILYRDETSMCQDCRGVVARLHAAEKSGGCTAAVADVAERIERLAERAALGLPLFAAGDAA